jgi:hypothetical protein
MAKGDDHHEKEIVGNGVDDSVVTGSNSKPWPTAQLPRGWRSRIVSQEGDDSLNPKPDFRVELPQRPHRGRP